MREEPASESADQRSRWVPAERAYAEASPFQQPRPEPLLGRTIPISQDLPEYRPQTGRRDVVAGLTVAALAIPSALAYGELAGVSPANGLYALLLPTVAFALLASSKQVIVGPEGSTAALIAAAVLPLAVAGSPEAAELAAMLGLLVGGCYLLAWIARLGWIADYFSRPVLIGYLHGVAVVLIISQLGKLLGVPVEARDPIPQLVEVIRELGEVNGATLAVSAVALIVLLTLRYVMPRFPAALAVVLGAILVSWALDFEANDIAVVGDIPAGLPRIDVPLPPLKHVVELLPAAFGIFLVTFADGILTARSFAGRHGQHVRAGQEMLAFAASNAAAGISQGFPIGASGSRTAVNDAMGVRTQVAGLAAAAAVVLVLLFLTEPIGYLPKAVLGAVIVSAALGLIDRPAWQGLWMVDRTEVAIAAVTLGGVVIFGVLEALTVAVGLTIVDVVRRSASPHDAVLGWVERLGRYADVSVHRSAKVTPGVVVYRLDDRLFFANARYVTGRVQEAVRGAFPPVSWLVFDAEAMTHVDASGLEALRELTQSLRREGISLVFARMKDSTRRTLDEAGLTEEIGAERFYPTVRVAVTACSAAIATERSAAAGTEPAAAQEDEDGAPN